MSKFEAIPNYTELRAGKAGYDTRYEINTWHPLHHDPLVDPREPEFGFSDASSYYSKPNQMTGERLPGVPDAPLVRLDVARRLVRANNFLQTDQDVREALGVPARIKIDDALRPYEVQVFAHDVAWPELLREKYPGINEEEIAKEQAKYIGKPQPVPTPLPHQTGGAVDVILMNVETNNAFDRGHARGSRSGSAFPEFHEGYQLLPGQSDIEDIDEKAEIAPADSVVVLGRRILYYAMTTVGGLGANPNEIWHYGKGDPMSEYVLGTHRPYYGIAELPDWYRDEMQRLQAKS